MSLFVFVLLSVRATIDTKYSIDPRHLCLTLVYCFSSEPTEVPGPVRHEDTKIQREHWGEEGCAAIIIPLMDRTFLVEQRGG